jgi:hypothetical protein
VCRSNQPAASGGSLLILAAYHDHSATVRMLLRHGGRVAEWGAFRLSSSVVLGRAMRALRHAFVLVDTWRY